MLLMPFNKQPLPMREICKAGKNAIWWDEGVGSVRNDVSE